MKNEAITIFKNRHKDKTSRLFFTAFLVFTIIILLLGVLGVVGIISRNADEVIFKSIGLGIAIVWACIFLGYFLWAIHFYNINYGITDKDWENIEKAKERKKLGEDVPDHELEEPKYNPYQDETFGLPGGTVRGMIAFTLLFGGIAIMIVSMGMDNELAENTFFWDHYEFYKTAFLMMIAFYFGSRSLEYLKDRWPSARRGKSDLKKDEKKKDDWVRYVSDETGAEPGMIKKILVSAEAEEAAVPPDSKKSATMEKLKFEYVQIRDNETSKFLDDDQIESVATEFNIEFAALKSVIQVESAGRGFLEDGRPKILFEGHRFWQNLTDKGISPGQYLPENRDILYKKWTREFYIGGVGEYDRLNKAMLIDKEAAMYSASWGLFQILGENLKTKWVRRHKDIFAFVDAQYESEYEHLLDFIDFVRYKKSKGKTLLEHLQALDWAAFAYGYNGSGYKTNNYDTKLQRYYEQFKHIPYV